MLDLDNFLYILNRVVRGLVNWNHCADDDSDDDENEYGEDPWSANHQAVSTLVSWARSKTITTQLRTMYFRPSLFGYFSLDVDELEEKAMIDCFKTMFDVIPKNFLVDYLPYDSREAKVSITPDNVTDESIKDGFVRIIE